MGVGTVPVPAVGRSVAVARASAERRGGPLPDGRVATVRGGSDCPGAFPGMLARRGPAMVSGAMILEFRERITYAPGGDRGAFFINVD